MKKSNPYSSPPFKGEHPDPSSDGSGEGVRNYQKISNLPAQKNLRRNLRKRLTPAEAALWSLINRRQLKGRKFRRQYSIGPYILDYFCPEERLGIELDGEVHMNSSADDKDEMRSRYLEMSGIRVIRFENRMVFDMPESLLRIVEENFGWFK